MFQYILQKEEGVTLTTNSFSMACEKMCCLPQYHPDYLIQLLNLGKVRRIRAILRHLVTKILILLIDEIFIHEHFFNVPDDATQMCGEILINIDK